MSLLAALVFVVLWRGVTTRPHRIGIVAGYLAASPVALVGSLVGGLVLPPVWGTMLYGGVPLIWAWVSGRWWASTGRGHGRPEAPKKRQSRQGAVAPRWIVARSRLQPTLPSRRPFVLELNYGFPTYA